MDYFLYVGSVVTITGGVEEGVKRHIRQVNRNFIQLYPWKNKNISRKAEAESDQMRTYVR